MHKTRIICLLILILTVLSAGVYLYPAIRQERESTRQGAVRISYEEAVVLRKDAENEAELARAHAYNEALQSGTYRDPFSGSPELPEETYLSLLNVGGVMGVLEYPSLGISLPVYHGTAEETLEKGAGHLYGTSLPVGGEKTHCVLIGHSGLPFSRMFDDLEQAETGDRFFLSVLGTEYGYEVESVRTVLPEELERILPEEFLTGKDGDYVTLITCTPYGINTHRLLVTGRRIADGTTADAADNRADDAAQDREGDGSRSGTDKRAAGPSRRMLVQRILVCAAVIAGVLVLMILLTRIRPEEESKK